MLGREFEAATIGFGQSARERQAATVRSLMVCRAVEDRCGLGVIDTAAFVLDQHTRPADQDGHGAAAVTERVLDEHIEDLADQPWRADCGLDTTRCHDDLAPLLRELWLPVADVMLDE